MPWEPSVLRRSARRALQLKGIRYRKDIYGNVTQVSTGFSNLTIEERMAMPEESASETHGFTMNMLRTGVELPKPQFTPDPPAPSVPKIEW